MECNDHVIAATTRLSHSKANIDLLRGMWDGLLCHSRVLQAVRNAQAGEPVPHKPDVVARQGLPLEMLGIS